MMRRHLVVRYAGGFFLLGLLVFLYAQSSAVDVREELVLNSELRQLRQLDNRLSLYVLRRHSNLLLNYDPLVQTEQHMAALRDSIERRRPDLFTDANHPVGQAFQQFRQQYDAKVRLLERFKSQYAVLHNSLRYFPVASQELIEKLVGGEPLEEALRDRLMVDMLAYQNTLQPELLARVERDIGELVELAAHQPAARRTQVDTVLKHARILLDYRNATEDTMRQLFALTSTERLDEVLARYGDEFERAERQADVYRFWLMAFALSGLLYGAWSLIRIRRAQDLLHASMRELEFQKYALDQHSIVSITDRSGKITYTNDKFSEISQYSRDELLGQDHKLLNSGHHPGSFFKEMWQTIGNGQVWHGEVKNRRKDGSFYWVDSTIVPFMNETGRPVRYVSIRSDITKRKQVEAEMLRARVAAEEASQAKSDFLANMSHEIRTPMNGILGMTELALDTELNDEQREFIGLVKASADSLLTLVNDILDFSKIEAGKMEFEDIEFCPQDMLTQTLRSTALRAHQKGLELLLDIDSTLPQRLIGDPGRLRQVLLNLVGNAIKFTEQGEIVVRVSLRETKSDVRHVGLRFSVSDTGIGIPADKQQAIFESFSQADTSTTRKYGGTGLGLTISTRLVEMMQGSIRVESEVGKGSTFHVDVVLQCAAETVKPTFDAGRLAGIDVLVVDDNASNREITAKLLRGWRMLPHAVASGAEAIAELDRAHMTGQGYPLLLLDARMPAMDGFAVVEHLRQHPALKAATVMMLTSEGQRGDTARCRELGIATYLLKPYAQGDLLAAVQGALGIRLADQAPLLSRPMLGQNRRSLRVLLAEDNSVNQTLATRLLQKFGHEVDVAANGVIAVEKWKQADYDLILMDVDMPELNGYDATAQIRQVERTNGGHIPIIGLTAHAMQGAREMCLAHGMDGYLTKPINTEALWAELEGVMPTEHTGIELSGSVKPVLRYTFDLPRVMALMADDQTLFREMVRIYLEDYPVYLAGLYEAVAHDNAEQIRYGAHTIKGMLSIFAVEAISDIAQRIEEQAGVDHRANLQELDKALQWLGRELKKQVDSSEISVND